METYEIYEKIRDMLNSSVSDIFAKIADEYNIVYADCPSNRERDINDDIVELAANMADAVKSQFE